MDVDGPIYRGAHDRLVAELSVAESDLRFLIDDLRKLEKLEEVPSERTLVALGVRLNELDGRRPAIEAPLIENSQLAAAAAEPVSRLIRAIRAGRKKADFLDGAPLPQMVAEVRAAAQNTVAEFELARDAALEIPLPYRVKRQVHGLRVGRAIDFKADYGKDLPTSTTRSASRGTASAEPGGTPRGATASPGHAGHHRPPHRCDGPRGASEHLCELAARDSRWWSDNLPRPRSNVCSTIVPRRLRSVLILEPPSAERG